MNRSHEAYRRDQEECRFFVTEIGRTAMNFEMEAEEQLPAERHTWIGRLALDLSDDMHVTSGSIQASRGGNYKVIRENLQKSGKANSKQPLPPEQKRIRRRKRRKKKS